MIIDAPSLIDRTVTVVNRLRTPSGDEWRATVIDGCMWARTEGRAQSSGSVSPSSQVTLQIPEEACGSYVEPADYDGDGWTLRTGDWVCLGAVELPGTSASSMREAVDAADSAVVTAVRDLRGRGAVSVPGPLGKWASILYAEAR